MIDKFQKNIFIPELSKSDIFPKIEAIKKIEQQFSDKFKLNLPVYWPTATMVPIKHSKRNIKVRFIWSSQSSKERSLKMLKFLIVPSEPSNNMFEHFPYEKVSYLIFKGSSAIKKPNFQQFFIA